MSGEALKKHVLNNSAVICLIAGESSGDLIAYNLMKSLKRKSSVPLKFVGIGGPLMEAEGLEPLFPISDISVIGVLEIIPHVRRILKRVKETISFIKEIRPQAVISVDVPAFSFRVEKELKDAGIPLLHYVAPTVWAWRPKRAEKISKFLNHLLTVFPFEPPYFEKHGLKTTFVGHPVKDVGIEKGCAERFHEKYGLLPGEPVLTILPGSRRSELKKHLPIFERTLHDLWINHPHIHIAIPVVPHLRETVRTWIAAAPFPVSMIEGEMDKYDCFKASTVALAASGTVTLELACAGLPTVAVYKTGKATEMVVRRMIKIPYVCMVNILLNKRAIPELLQADCTPEKIRAALNHLLESKEARDEQKKALKQAADMLSVGNTSASDQAAEAVLPYLQEAKKQAA